MIHHTNNATTTIVGQSTASVIADTLNDETNVRITTLELVYPRYIHSEFMTHRVFSRNASSSRATPLKVTLAEVYEDPVFFDQVLTNQPGMIGDKPLSEDQLKQFESDWRRLGATVAGFVEMMSLKYNIHKQTLNRALEPWTRIRVLVTATSWNGFFNLRLVPDAQPEIQSLANAMKAAMDMSEPKNDIWHLPYVDDRMPNTCERKHIEMSIARCARVSYARHDGKASTYEEDKVLFDRLLKSWHMSPFEHAAVSKEGWHANFYGWQSVRNMYEENPDCLK